MATIMVYRYRQNRGVAVEYPLGFGMPLSVFQIPNLALSFTNALWLASAQVYVFCALWGLLVAFLAFVQPPLAPSPISTGDAPPAD
jgi:hypothetical protein